ncbi:hypothetical protein MBLNU13_g03769t1 [Cladosporium sp. NU13]
MFARVRHLAAYLLIASAAAAPSLTSGLTSAAEMDVYPSDPPTAASACPKIHGLQGSSAREDDTNFKVKVYENSIMTFGQLFNLKKGESHPISPPTFTNLWNDVVAASCNDAECGEHIGKASTKRHMHTIQGGTLEMWLEGTFWGE